MMLKFLCLLPALLAVIPHTNAAPTNKIVCYFASWAGYRNGFGSFKPENINPNLCTHVLYTFLGVNSDGTLALLDSWNDINLGALSKVSNLKRANPDLKVLISIGGFNAGNAILNGIAASSKLRTNLIGSCLTFFQTWGYDGLDVDWQFPLNSDKANFVLLLQELRAAFDANGYILSVSASASPLTSYDIPAISRSVDLINLMTYNYYLSYLGVTALNSPLYGALSVNSSVQNWLIAGADAGKLTLSVPFYGHSFSLSNVNLHDLGSPASSGIGGPYTQNPGVLGFNEICEFYNDWKRVWVKEAQVPYKYSGTNWVSYDDEESIGLKAQYATSQGLAGVAIWSIDTDDFRGRCGTAHALLHAIKNNLG